VRYSHRLEELIEFEVEMSELPIHDIGKDFIVTWKMFDQFDANKTFWTDSNGLEMEERRIDYNPAFGKQKYEMNVSSNYYPVTSAIAFRDSKKNRQVTVMNDRTQGGSADLFNATIELMQHRRLR
jgi:hypothetical protein